jgi:5-methylthioadenosine/S-adenosylhomocysteine deaminase
MAAEGLNVALGTDGAASNNNLNMMEEIHLASVIHNGRTRDPLVMKPAQVLRMATANGAKLQGRGDTGSLEVGKKADVIAFDLDRPHLVPNRDPLALLAYSAQGSDVCMTMVDGKILYENGEYLTMDREKVLADAKAACRRIYG